MLLADCRLEGSNNCKVDRGGLCRAAVTPGAAPLRNRECIAVSHDFMKRDCRE